MKLTNENIKFALIGGDLRQIFTGVALAEKGYEVALFGFDDYNGDIGLCTRCFTVDDAVQRSSAIILGNPVSNDGENLYLPMNSHNICLNSFLDKIEKECVVLGGRCKNLSSQQRERVVDYFEREELTVANAYITAESAVGIAMQEMKESLLDMTVLVMGYGRIGKSLCHILKGMGANVYASARKESDFAWIRAYGYSPVDTSKICDIVAECKLVFNTIPRLVLGERILSCLQKDTLIIDLASKPGGVDFEAANKCGLKTLWALGLPGKKLPVSAGRVQASVIIDILDDMGVI